MMAACEISYPPAPEFASAASLASAMARSITCCSIVATPRKPLKRWM